jgi:hypothetical protein
MKKLLTRSFVGVAAVGLPLGASVALPTVASAAAATVTNSSATANDGVNAETATKSVTANSNWTIVNETLTVQTATPPGYAGWVDTFSFTQKTPANSQTATSLTGTVTLTTPYGTATSGFVATNPNDLPFDVVSPGNLVVNGYGSGHSTSNDIYNTEYQMVYSGLNPGVNAWYWF